MKNKKRLATLLVLSTLFTGCGSSEKTPMEDYDIIEQDTKNGEGFNELTQVMDVDGESFKLVAVYSCDDNSKRTWRITSDKFLYLNVYTTGLPNDTSVWIDNVHIDTSIKSQYAVMDGIMQDSMDDHVHNSQMLGFPVGNDTHYYGVNLIEGANETFISGFMHGVNGYSRGEVDSKRYTESDLVNDYGVWGNKISVVYDLLVQGPNDKTPRNISVSKDFVVKVTSPTKKKEKDLSFTESKEEIVYIKSRKI